MISLRPHVREDIPLRIKWLNNKKSNTFLVDDPNHITTEQEQNEWFNKYETEGNKKFFTVLADKVPIGFTGLSNINKEDRTATVFIVIGEDDYRGKGNGRIILNLLLKEGQAIGVKKFTLSVYSKNIPAVQLYTKAGFIESERIDDSMISMYLHMD